MFATCKTVGCPNEGIAIELIEVTECVTCGPCGQQIELSK